MKKYIAILMLILIVFSVCSCNKSEKNNEQYLDRIFEVENAQYTDEKEFNHKNIISSDVVHSKDTTVLSEKKVKLNGEDVTVKYNETLFYPVGEITLHSYLVDGDPEKEVLIDNDGNVNSILFKYDKIDISGVETLTDVCALAKEELSKYFDISKYRCTSILRPVTDINSSPWMCTFQLYNTVDGCISDRFRFSVYDDGSLFAVRTFDSGVGDIKMDIDNEKVKEIVELKLKDVYDTDKCEYVSFTTYHVPSVIKYNGEVCIEYYASALYVRKGDSSETAVSSFINMIIIPLELIISNS